MQKKKPKIKNLTYLGSTVLYWGKSKKPPVIYTVTSIQEKGYIEPFDSKYMRHRCWGWFPTLKEAKKSVEINSGDMAECCYYSHVVIEKVPCGICNLPESEVWYRWKVDPKDPHGSTVHGMPVPSLNGQKVLLDGVWDNMELYEQGTPWIIWNYIRSDFWAMIFGGLIEAQCLICGHKEKIKLGWIKIWFPPKVPNYRHPKRDKFLSEHTHNKHEQNNRILWKLPLKNL